MRFGAILPLPGTASPEDVLTFAAAAEDLGYHSVWMNSRVVRPVEMQDRHPYCCRCDARFAHSQRRPMAGGADLVIISGRFKSVGERLDAVRADVG